MSGAAEVPIGAEHGFEAAYPLVRVARGCTQEDAPAVEITFYAAADAKGEPALPYIRIEISGSVRERLPRATYRLMPLRRDPAIRQRIVRAEMVGRDFASTWLGGAVAIEADDPDKGLSGRFDLNLPNGAIWSRSFAARYATRAALCG